MKITIPTGILFLFQ